MQKENREDQNKVLKISETENIPTLRYIELQREYNVQLREFSAKKGAKTKKKR